MLAVGEAEDTLDELFRRLRGSSGLIMITAELAAHLPEGLLADAVREQRPPVMVVWLRFCSSHSMLLSW